MSYNHNPPTEFENVINSLKSGKLLPKNISSNKKPNKSKISNSTEIFDSIKEQNTKLNNSMAKMKDDIIGIKEKNSEAIENNLTFSALFTTLEVSVQEYEYQSTIFEQYATLYDEMCNEENIVKILDLLRLIVTDRRAILNDLTKNLIQIQRLNNDKIKIDNSNKPDEDGDDLLVSEIISPDSI